MRGHRLEEVRLSFSGVQALSTVTDFNYTCNQQQEKESCQKGDELWSEVGCLWRKVGGIEKKVGGSAWKGRVRS